MLLHLHCGKITLMEDLGVDDGEKAWSQEGTVHACHHKALHLDSGSGEEGDLILNVISEVKIDRKL